MHKLHKLTRLIIKVKNVDIRERLMKNSNKEKAGKSGHCFQNLGVEVEGCQK